MNLFRSYGTAAQRQFFFLQGLHAVYNDLDSGTNQFVGHGIVFFFGTASPGEDLLFFLHVKNHPLDAVDVVIDRLGILVEVERTVGILVVLVISERIMAVILVVSETERKLDVAGAVVVAERNRARTLGEIRM